MSDIEKQEQEKNKSEWINNQLNNVHEYIIVYVPFNNKHMINVSLEMTLESFYTDILAHQYNIHSVTKKGIHVFRDGHHTGIRLDLYIRHMTLYECGLMDNDVLCWGV